MPRGPLFIAVLLVAAQARATSPDRIKLRWHLDAGTDSCVAEADVRRAVAARLGRDPFAADGSYVIDGNIDRQAGKYRLRIRMVDDGGREMGVRDIESNASDCAGISQAAILAVALAAAEAKPAEHGAPPVPEASSAAEIPPESEPVVAPPRRTAAPSGSYGVRALLAVGVLGPYGAGASAGFYRHSASGVAVDARAIVLLPAQKEENAEHAALLALGWSFCFDAGHPRSMSICLGAQAGDYAVTFEGGGPKANRGWLAGTIGPRFEVRPTAGIMLDVGGELLLPVIDHALVRSDASRTSVPPQGGLLVYFGVGPTFP